MGMVDCVGKEINIGDKVICADSRYADLLIGEVVKLTPQKAWVRYHRSEYGKQYVNEKLKESYQIFKYAEVVRCKGCKYWDEDQYGCKCSFHSQKENEDYPAFEVEMLPNDFCSYGERKDND